MLLQSWGREQGKPARRRYSDGGCGISSRNCAGRPPGSTSGSPTRSRRPTRFGVTHKSRKHDARHWPVAYAPGDGDAATHGRRWAWALRAVASLCAPILILFLSHGSWTTQCRHPRQMKTWRASRPAVECSRPKMDPKRRNWHFRPSGRSKNATGAVLSAFFQGSVR